ncbi:unnamed protein product [Lactuca virosa]|uniref:Uncharacterized protein n=1 Tax=Lactuca virosa TaxID=75947 RepID=A0AAU9P425_9ASTR|nr:unnamed protein product [Lactuca virosa]
MLLKGLANTWFQRQGKRFLVAYANIKDTTRPLTLKCQNVTKKQKVIQTQNSMNIQVGGEDDVMGDAVEPQAQEVMRVNEYEEVVRVNEAEELVRVNEGEELGRVNEVVGHVYSRG